MRSAQDVFDTVTSFLRAQGVQAKDPISRICRYRTTTGLKCAVGCLIPDANYTLDMEGCHCSEAFVFNALEDLGLSLHLELLEDLQEVHDNVKPLEWEQVWRTIAEKRKLIPFPADHGEQ